MAQDSSSAPTIILGLGNPGDDHAGNRHNIGAQCLALFARRHNVKIDTTWPRARIGRGTIDGEEVVLARPRVYMNESGLAATTLLERLNAQPEQLVVLCDELDLPHGKVRIRPQGSTAGHRGLTSIERMILTSDFPRIRIGIGRPYPQEERRTRSREDYEEGIIRWVLGDFTKLEEEVMGPIRERVADALDCLLKEGITVAMNRYN